MVCGCNVTRYTTHGPVIAKVIPDAPHETLLVLDATTGQNTMSQAEIFNEAIPLSGLVMTKLDGTFI